MIWLHAVARGTCRVVLLLPDHPTALFLVVAAPSTPGGGDPQALTTVQCRDK